MEWDGTTAEVLVKGTLNAKGGPAILIDSDTSAGSVSVIAWKVESGAENLVMEEANGGRQHTDKAEQLEKSIKYIIKVDAAQTDRIQTSYGTEEFSYTSMLDSTDYKYDTAEEGTKVGVKLDIPEGYRLKAAYSDEGHTINLMKDSDGSYYLIVPKGGGVLISMELELIKQEDKEEDKKEDKKEDRKEDNKGDNTGNTPPVTGTGLPFTLSKDGNLEADLAKNVPQTIKAEDLKIFLSGLEETLNRLKDIFSQTGNNMEDLVNAYNAFKLGKLIIRTGNGHFEIPYEVLLKLIQNAQTVTFFYDNTMTLSVYVDSGTEPVYRAAHIPWENDTEHRERFLGNPDNFGTDTIMRAQ